MRTRIDGQLLAHAEPRRYSDGTSVLVVLVAPDQAGALPVLAKHAGQPVVRLTLVSHIEHEAAPAFHETQPAAIAA